MKKIFVSAILLQLIISSCQKDLFYRITHSTEEISEEQNQKNEDYKGKMFPSKDSAYSKNNVGFILTKHLGIIVQLALVQRESSIEMEILFQITIFRMK